jgi:hypothetical protein
MDDLRVLACIKVPLSLGCTCLALSTDGKRLAVCGEEPDAKLFVVMWKQVREAWSQEQEQAANSYGVSLLLAYRVLNASQGEQLAAADLPHGMGTVCSMSFHPYESDRLATTFSTESGLGRVVVWHVQRLWDHCSLKHEQVRLALGLQYMD